LRLRHPRARLFAIFEPRSATACRNFHQTEYAESFDHADEVLLAPLGRAGLPADERLDVERLARDLRVRGRAAEAYSSVEAIGERVVEGAQPGDVVAILSNGAFGGIHENLLEELAAKSRGSGT
jgi:UDP-N-acetylmuramate: L-alanyl-gamma-D-glutamyl-meso-diaminopimelate ligase